MPDRVEPAVYFTTVHPPAECACTGRRDTEPRRHVWDCPARCRSFAGVGLAHCAFGAGHDGHHESYNETRWA